MGHALAGRLDKMLLSPLARKVRGRRLTYLSAEKLRSLETLLRRVAHREVVGAYMEFGVALGGSAILIAGHCPRGHTFHGYDVFGMIPPPGPNDDTRSHERYAEICAGRSPGLGSDVYYGYREGLYDQVCQTFADFNYPVDGARVNLHRGLFEDTLNPQATKPVAFAHIDCDWFEPVRYCLDALVGRLSPGAIVVLDDYNDYGGCRKAVDAFVDANDSIRVLRLLPHAVLERI